MSDCYFYEEYTHGLLNNNNRNAERSKQRHFGDRRKRSSCPCTLHPPGLFFVLAAVPYENLNTFDTTVRQSDKTFPVWRRPIHRPF